MYSVEIQNLIIGFIKIYQPYVVTNVIPNWEKRAGQEYFDWKALSVSLDKMVISGPDASCRGAKKSAVFIVIWGVKRNDICRWHDMGKLSTFFPLPCP